MPFSDPKYQEKRELLTALGQRLYAALDDPDFNGSRPTTAAERERTGKNSTNPILLATYDRPLKHSQIGPRTCVLKVPAGMHSERLQRAAEKVNLRAVIPWEFDGQPQVYPSGSMICIEVAWPADLHTSRITLGSLGPGVSDGSAARLGASNRAETVTLTLDDQLHAHLLVAGTTGSGKSTAIRTIVSQWAHDPRATFVLADGKDGQGLQPLDGLAGQIGPLALDQAAITNALGWAWSEMKQRNALSAADRQRRHDPLFVVMDDCDEYTASDPTISRLTYLIAKQGRAAGVHLIFGTQSPRQTMFLDKGTKGQIPVRLALKVTGFDESEAALDHSTPRADYLLGVGDAHLAAPGQVERLQLAYAEDDYIAAVTGHAPAFRNWPQFDAGRLARAEDDTSRAQPFSNQEAVIAMAAAKFGWGKDKTNRILGDMLGYGMGSDRIRERLLPLGEELAGLWAKLEAEK